MTRSSTRPDLDDQLRRGASALRPQPRPELRERVHAALATIERPVRPMARPIPFRAPPWLALTAAAAAVLVAVVASLALPSASADPETPTVTSNNGSTPPQAVTAVDNEPLVIDPADSPELLHQALLALQAPERELHAELHGLRRDGAAIGRFLLDAVPVGVGGGR